MMRRGLKTMATVLGLGLGLGVAGTALARDENKRGDFNVFLSGGLSDYTGSAGRDVQTGPSWGLTFNMQPMRFLGFELGYDGSRNTVANDVLPDATLTRHGATSLVKLAPPFIEKVKPFVGVGLGASYVTANGGLGTSDSDFVEEVPVAAGVEFNKGSLTAGLRATYRMLMDENFAADTSAQGGIMDASLTLGGRF